MPRKAQALPSRPVLRKMTLRLPEELIEALYQLAQREMRPINSQVTVLLRQALAATAETPDVSA